MLSLITACCGRNEITRQWLAETVASCAGDPEVIIVSNGSTREEVDELRSLIPGPARLFVYDDPLGSAKAFNIGAAVAKGDVLALLHNDLMTQEQGWDQELLNFFAAHTEAGVVGFHGARGVGAPDIYRTPYQLIQLARWDTFSNMVDAENHGARVQEPRRAAVLDGMGLCCRRDDYLAWGGMDENLGPHHLYDLDLCLRALHAGRMNYMLPIRVKHLGGQTATQGRYNDWARSVGYAEGDSTVHREAHEKFYAKWFGRLPVSV